MRDDYLGLEWADNHRIWADTAAFALNSIVRLPAMLRKGTRPERVEIGLACVRGDSSIKEA